MRRLIIAFATALAVAVTLAITATSALALTGSQANSKGAGWQHYICGEIPGTKCDNKNLVLNSCNGPHAGGIQWNCTGAISIFGYDDGVVICDVESSWNSAGTLVHSWYGCNDEGPRQ